VGSVDDGERVLGRHRALSVAGVEHGETEARLSQAGGDEHRSTCAMVTECLSGPAVGRGGGAFEAFEPDASALAGCEFVSLA